MRVFLVPLGVREMRFSSAGDLFVVIVHRCRPGQLPFRVVH